MYHLRLKGDHYQMGVKRGTIFQKGNISFPLHLDAFQLEHGKQSEQILKKYFPEVCEEIRGVSDTIGADYLSFASWMLCMGCCMYNLEQNIPVEIRGCTAFAYPHIFVLFLFITERGFSCLKHGTARRKKPLKEGHIRLTILLKSWASEELPHISL